MASWGGHTLPGTFFILFGIFYAFKFSRSYLKRKNENGSDVKFCCNGRIPVSGIVVEGMVKIFMISVGSLVELFYPGAPMGRLHDDKGDFTHPMNWQHATMYMFFGLSGIADILSHTARHVVPAGFDRIFGALALFVEGYLFFFHLHGRSNIDTRVHVLLVLTVWPGALFTFLHCLVIKKRQILHIFEMLTATLLIAQGTWFWQAAYVLYPPGGESWDPCSSTTHHEGHSHFQNAGEHELQDCNMTHEAGLNLMFLTLFWSWHIAASFCFVALVYICNYQFLKLRGKLDPIFEQNYEKLPTSNGTALHTHTPLDQALLTEDEEEEI